MLKVLPRLNMPLFVISLTNLDDIGKKLEKKRIKIYYLGLRKDCLNIFNVIYKFKKIIKKEKPNILNSYLIHANLFTRIFGRMFGVKKIICSVRNKHVNKPILMFIDKITSGLVNLYLPNSNAVAKFMIKKGFNKKKIIVLPNGIDFDEIIEKNNKTTEKAKNKLSLPKDKIIIGTVGNLLEQKDHKTIIRAISKLDNNYILCIIGKGPLKNELIDYARELNVSGRLIIKDKINNAKEVIQAFDVFVLSSLHEGMSNALLEAMASKIPVIVSDIEENTELIEDKVNGLTFEVGNYTSLLNEIKNVKESITKTYVKKAQEKIKEKYSVNTSKEEYQKIILSFR